MGRNELLWIKLMVAEGLDWKLIRARLRLDKNSLQKIMHDNDKVKSLRPHPDTKKAYASAYLFTILVKDKK
ncbi:hypothetical protein BGZ81_008815, partial [Podila clonocystis]